jgi:hypothetical protein
MLACVTGCSSAAPESGGDTAALAADVRATNCEIFVDRAMAVTGSHALTQITFYLKTQNDRLDAPIDHVGFYRRRVDPYCPSPGHEHNCDDSQAWSDERLRPFVGASDYFELSLLIGGDYAAENTFEGAFYVQTTKGTKYWANAEGGGNFLVDRATFNQLVGLRPSPAYASDPQAAVVIAEDFAYLNPQRCR